MTTTWSPSSLQLRLALGVDNSRRLSHSIAVRAGLRKFNRRSRALCVSQDSGSRSDLSSWTGSDNGAGSLSGWSGSDDGREPKPLDKPPKEWSGGIVGAGVAGVLLATGLAFAVLSTGKKGLKPEMEPLTAQQELLLSPDDQNIELEEHEKVKQDNVSQAIETGVNKDPASFQEHNECLSESSGKDGTNDRLVQNDTYMSADIVTPKSASSEEDPQVKSTFDDRSTAPETSFISPILPEYEGDVALATSENIDGQRSQDEVAPETTSTYGPTEDLIDDDNKNEIPVNLTAKNGGVRLDLQYESAKLMNPPSESTALEDFVDSRFNTILEPKAVLTDKIEKLFPPSAEEKGNLDKASSLSVEVIHSAMEERDLDETGLSSTKPRESLAYAFESEQAKDGQAVKNESRSFSESQNPANTFWVAGIPAPSAVFESLRVIPGKMLVPPTVDQVQGQALAALQALKVIESDVKGGDICTRREYARWLVSASSALSRNSVSKVYPAMYIENVTELAFDDITPEDPDFVSIQGLAEAGLISSKLSRQDMMTSTHEAEEPCYFFPESPLSRQDLVSWRMALENNYLPEASREGLRRASGFIDIDKIDPDACPAIVADLAAGEQGIIALAFGYTKLFQPDKPVTKAQAAIALATGKATDLVSEELARIEAEAMAENAVAAHSALVAQVEKDINASFEKVLSLEREKIDAVEKMAEEARSELERLRSKREEDNIALMKERAAVESEMEILSRLRREVEEQLESLMSNKIELSYEKERMEKLRVEAERENQEIARLQYELEVERKALAMARAWAEDEAKRAREHAKALAEARDRWERQGIKVVVANDLQEETFASDTWINAGKELSVEGTVSRAEALADKLRDMATKVGDKSKDLIDKIIQVIMSFISEVKKWSSDAAERADEIRHAAFAKARTSAQELQQSMNTFSHDLKEGVKRLSGDCKEGVEKLTQRFKT